jgi:fatty-acyl-CoA synthase
MTLEWAAEAGPVVRGPSFDSFVQEVADRIGVRPGALPLTLADLLNHSARRYGRAPALLEPERQISYAALRQRSLVLAKALRNAGVDHGDRVALLAPNGIEFVVGLFGIAHAGGVAVLLNALGTRKDLEAAIAVTEPSVLITARDDPTEAARELIASRFTPVTGGNTAPIEVTARAVSSAGDTLRWLVRLQAESHPEVVEIEPVGPDLLVEPDDEAVVLFTSGSTGAPKAVSHSHRAVCVQMHRWGALLGLTTQDRLMSFSPYFWSSGLCKSLGSSLVSGAAVLALARFRPETALQFMAAAGATKLISPLHLDHQLVSDATFADTDLSRLRGVHRRSPLKAALGLSENWSPGGYGMSEMCTLVSSYPATVDPGALANSEGWVLPGVEMCIVDTQTGEKLPPSCSGRIYVRGVTRMRGYVGTQDPFDADGFFPTSDFGRVDRNGRVFFEGRMDSLVRTSGANVAPVEVENSLVGWHRLVRSAAVAVPHPDRGQILVLCAVPARDDVTVDEVTTYIRARLAAYKVPRLVLLFATDELHYTPTHKIDLVQARHLAIQRMRQSVTDPAWAELLDRELEK